MKTSKFKHVLKVESLAAILFSATVLFVIAFQCLQREYNIDAHSTGWKSHVADDRIDGGSSFIENLSNDSQLKFAFETQDTNGKAYALYLLMPEDVKSTTDLSWFTDITIKAHVENSQPQQFLVILRDKVDRLYLEDDTSSMKYNESFLELTDKTQTIKIPKDSFQVPRWWVVEKAVQPEDTAPTFNNFTWIEFAILDPQKASSGTVVIDSITFTGPFIPPVDFYRGLFGVWFLLALPLCTRFYTNSKKTRSIRRSRRNHESEGKTPKVRSEKGSVISDTIEIDSHDSLTGLPNRFGVRDDIDKAIQAVRNGDEKANVILFDVDDLQLLNKTRGEPEGDRLLQQIAAIASAALPPKHTLARWGGDQFLILCLGQSRESSKDLACELRKQIERETSSTCSFGVHQINPINHFEEVFERASKCVDEAKFKGKNKVVLFNLRAYKPSQESVT